MTDLPTDIDDAHWRRFILPPGLTPELERIFIMCELFREMGDYEERHRVAAYLNDRFVVHYNSATDGPKKTA